MYRFLHIILLSIVSFSTIAQNDSILKVRKESLVGIIDSSEVKKYPFIRFEKNTFDFYGTKQSENFDSLYQKLSNIKDGKPGKLNFYHIGGSHLQADVHSHQIRTFLQKDIAKKISERGLVFPYNFAKTNNPQNYQFSSPNTWKGYRSVIVRKDSLDYGLTSIIAETKDSIIDIHFEYKKTIVNPPFDLIQILHQKDKFNYSCVFKNDSSQVLSITTDTILGLTTIKLNKEVRTFDLTFSKIPVYKDSTVAIDTFEKFQLYGFFLKNNRDGISYNSIGVNGAGLYTYLANKNFEEQLTIYKPDLFIFSVGTNDGNVPNSKFDPQVYKNNLELLMHKIWNVNPNCAMILTVPNDSYYQRKYLNKNIAKERTVIIELAEQYNLPVWDFYGIMGELGSSKTWKTHGLMQADYVHFTGAGYVLKGKLFSEAFIKFMNNYKAL